MKMSRMALSTSKSRLNSSDESLSTRILLQSGQLCRYSTGIYGKHNILVKVQAKINNIICTTLSKYDCVEVSLPLLQPKYLWEDSGRWQGYYDSGQMFVCEMQNGTFCLAPTAEEAIFAFVKDNLKSYKDLPVNLFQIGAKFRNELRSRGGLLRTKEFLMMDAYSFHASEEDLKNEYQNIRNAYFEIFSKFNLPVIPVAAVNGDMGGKMSEEFMFISEAGEDTILVSEDGKLGLNTEILDLPNAMEYLETTYGISDVSKLAKKHCIELGHIFQLGQRYSTTMGGYFRTANNEEVPYYMGCYGIGLSRTLAAICENNCDEEGLIWPKIIAPYQVTIVCHSDKLEDGLEVYGALQEAGIDVLFDDRQMSLGAKIKDAKLLGIPHMVVIGKKYQSGTYELEDRATGQKNYVSFTELLEIIK